MIGVLACGCQRSGSGGAEVRGVEARAVVREGIRERPEMSEGPDGVAARGAGGGERRTGGGDLAVPASVTEAGSGSGSASGSGRAGAPEAATGLGTGGRLVELSPGLRVGVARRVVEFDAIVSPLLHDPQNPTFYLEQIVSTPDTKAHESIFVTDVRPSEIHAAMLAAALDPGSPGSITQLIDDSNQIVTERIAASGDRVRMLVLYEDPATGERVSVDPYSWVVNQDTGERFVRAGGGPDGGVVLRFAGSNLRRFNDRDIYEADVAGTVVGLTTFGTELIGLDRVISHESEIDAPVWIADTDRIPANGTAVTIRIEGL
ncbi:MAG: YdjY domain-containing protein [Phycisphaerales bacterium]